jgi:signal transduction histidine kinase
LEASRLQAGTFQLDIRNEVAMDEMASSAVRRFESQTENHTLVAEFPADFPLVCGDERRLTQVFNNLLNNAIKYSPDGGRIELFGRAHGDYITISVRDEGIGIPVHEKHRIFEEFSRLDNAMSRNTEGTGLGLYLTKAIVEAHGGSIWFSSNELTEKEGTLGTTFTFSLPLDKPCVD